MSDLPSVASVASIEKRLAGVEGSLRRWKLGFAALALVVVGVAADGVVKDAEFGTVKARRFEVIGSDGNSYARMGSGINTETNLEQGSVFVVGDDLRKATIMIPGEPLFIKNKPK